MYNLLYLKTKEATPLHNKINDHDDREIDNKCSIQQSNEVSLEKSNMSLFSSETIITLIIHSSTLRDKVNIFEPCKLVLRQPSEIYK